MNAGKAVYGILSANSGVTDIVGTNIFPEIAEQETAVPFIVYQLQNVAPEDTHDGPSKLDEVQFEFLCYADSYNAAADLGVAVRAALDRVSGTYNGVHVESIQFNDVDVEIEYDPRRYSQVLKFTFRIKRDDVTIALGTPVTGAVLGDLSDVDVTGVTNGQLIAYNSTSGNWEAANDAGGAEQLNDLSDVIVNLPASGEVLKYDGGEFVNDNLTKADVGLGNVDNTSDADKPVSSATQTALDAKADTSAVPTDLNDLSDVSIVGTPTGNQALIYDGTAGVFKSLPNFTNRFEDEAENNKQSITPFAERVYTVKSDGDGIFIDPESDTPASGKVIERKIYHKAGFLESGAVIGDFTLIHTFADDTAYSATTSTFEGFRDGDTYGTPPFTLIQTWEEQTAAPAFTGLLNESYGSGAEAAYSTRRLNGNVTECMVIRRASDSTTTTIGFDSNGDIDEAAINTFCSGTTCTVSEWLDQSGNGNTATAPSTGAEPTIYTGGALVKENGKVAVDFDGSNDYLVVSSTQWTDGQMMSSLVLTGTGGASTYWADGNNTTFRFWNDGTNHKLIAWPLTPIVISKGSDMSTGQLLVVGRVGTSSEGYTLYENGSSVANTATYTGSMPTTSTDAYIGQNNNGTQRYQGKMQELVHWSTNKSSVRTSIESNIGDYFTQNTPLLDTYTGAAAAYSLRKLRTAYSGSAIRVRRASDNAESDIGFNVFGELSTVELAAFCGSSDGFVKTWYSQVGTGVDATQTNTANQPKIYDGTTGVVTENGKPAVETTGSFLAVGSAVSGIVDSFTVAKETGSDTLSYLVKSTGDLSIRTLSQAYRIVTTNSGDWANTSTSVYYNGSIPSSNPSSTIQALVYIGGGNRNFYQISTDFTGGSSQRDWEGNIQEIILYSSDQSSNRSGIESNINTFYSIY